MWPRPPLARGTRLYRNERGRMTDRPHVGRLRRGRPAAGCRLRGQVDRYWQRCAGARERMFDNPHEVDRDDTEIEAMVAAEALHADNVGS